MDYFDRNNLESIYEVLITEQCWCGTATLLNNQKHKNNFKSILLKKFHLNFIFERPQLLIVRGGHWRPLKRVYVNKS